MTLSKRGKATLLGALAFLIALVIYLGTRPDTVASARPSAGVGEGEGEGDGEAASRGRDLGRQLAALVGRAPGSIAAVTATPPSHVAGPLCDKCTTDNCAAGTDDGCDSISDAGDRKLCEDLFACFAEPANHCVVQGDALRCWCGDNMTTCVTDNAGTTQANGPCLQQVFAAAKSTDADTIFHKFLSADLPLGRAARLTLCRGAFCSGDCKIP